MTDQSRFSRYKHYAKDAYYHLYNRGNGRQNIFHSKEDYFFYINRLERYIKKYDVALICYVLMPNHIHLLAKQKTDTPIYKFVASLHTSYSIYFNKKNKHVGHVFQDRFKQIIINSDNQLLYLTKYIHRNPVEAGLAPSVSGYPWSSYHEYMRTLPWMLCEKEIVRGILGVSEETFAASYSSFCNKPISGKELNPIENSLLDQPL